ncbi:MAG: porin [Myxococcota bacterium]
MTAALWLAAAAWGAPDLDAPADVEVDDDVTAATAPGAGGVDEAVELSGFVKPVFSAVYRGSALPRDRLAVGLTSSTAGIVLRGEPVDHWRYKVFFTVGAGTFPVLVGARGVDLDNQGGLDRVDVDTAGALGDIVRETSITWAPVDAFAIRAGRMPVPFTSAAQSADTALLFPERAGPNQVFLADDDLGALLELTLPEDRVLAKAGVFNGSGTGPSGGERGVLYLARVDLQPLGPFAFDETRPLRSKPRLGLGAGAIWHPYRAFDAVGFERVGVNDLRLSGSFRFSAAGLSVAVEGLYRLQTDTLTSRPLSATGAYAQGGWRLPIAIEPIGRVGWSAVDRTFDPRTTVWTEGGLNVYPAHGDAGRDAIRLTFVYQGEHRVTEGETAHGAVAAAVLTF